MGLEISTVPREGRSCSSHGEDCTCGPVVEIFIITVGSLTIMFCWPLCPCGIITYLIFDSHLFGISTYLFKISVIPGVAEFIEGRAAFKIANGDGKEA